MFAFIHGKGDQGTRHHGHLVFRHRDTCQHVFWCGRTSVIVRNRAAAKAAKSARLVRGCAINH